MFNLNKETKDKLKELAHNTGISTTNLFFATELLFFFFSRNFDLSKITIKQNVYSKLALQLYSHLYNWPMFLICDTVLLVSLSLIFIQIPLPKFLKVTDGYANNTSRGFDSAAVFKKCWTIFIYYIHNVWIYLTALLIVMGQLLSFNDLKLLPKFNWLFLIINTLFLIGSFFYVDIPTYYYKKTIDISDYLLLNTKDNYALVKNVSSTHPLFFLVKLHLKEPTKGTVEVYSSEFAEVKYAFDNTKSRVIKPRSIDPGPVPKIDSSKLSKLSMHKKK